MQISRNVQCVENRVTPIVPQSVIVFVRKDYGILDLNVADHITAAAVSRAWQECSPYSCLFASVAVVL